MTRYSKIWKVHCPPTYAYVRAVYIAYM